MGHGLTSDEVVPPVDRAREALLMGLRLDEGIDFARFVSRTSLTIMDAVDIDILNQCVAEGYMIANAERLSATRQGRIRLDALLPALVL